MKSRAGVGAVAFCAAGLILVAQTARGQDLSRYRGFELGSSVSAVSTVAGVMSSTARTTHQRPALLQQLEWRPSRWTAGSTVASTDPVEQLVFSFYNNQLFRVVVDYVRERTEGMTDADMIDAISKIYGPALTVKSKASADGISRLDAESGQAIARWGDGSHTAVLYRTSSYDAGRRLIVTALPNEVLARQAEVQAIRLDEQEAPAREAAREKQQRADVATAADKARAANKDVFQP